MNQGQQWAALGLVVCLGFGILGLVASASNKDESPPPSISHVGPNDTPVYSTESVGEIDDDFQLIRLPDGHDYWFYRDGNRDKGYAAMAHSPECETCVAKTAN